MTLRGCAGMLPRMSDAPFLAVQSESPDPSNPARHHRARRRRAVMNSLWPDEIATIPNRDEVTPRAYLS